MQNTSQSFKNDLNQLQDVVLSAFAVWAVWKKLRLHDPSDVQWPIDVQNQVLGRWNGFFSPVGRALQHLAMIEIAKVFDLDSRTVSLPSLVQRAQQDARLVPHAKPNDLADIETRINAASSTIETIRKLRNQRLAHADSKPGQLPKLMSQEVEGLMEDIKFAFNTLAVAHDQNVYSWDSALKSSASNTTEILALLVNEIDRAKGEFDDRTVEIIVGQIQGIETTVGRQLDDEEFKQALDEFKPTPEQERRIRLIRSPDD